MSSGNLGGYRPDDNRTSGGDPFEPIPAGWYACTIVESEMRPTRDGSGEYLWLEIEVDDSYHPDIGRRKVWARLNIGSSNEKAKDIGLRQLNQICDALGKVQVDDSSELEHTPLAVRVKIRPATDQYDASNDVTSFAALEDKIKGATGGPNAGVPKARRSAPAAQSEPPKRSAPPTGGRAAPPWSK